MTASAVRVRRKAMNSLMLFLSVMCALIAITPVFALLYYVLRQGLPALNLSFLTNTPKPVGEVGGGMANALFGSVVLVLGACCIGVPIGLFGGLYLAEYGRSRVGWWVRYAADVLNGIPSIVMGLFAYAIIVVPQRHFSAFSGSVALGIMMTPMVMRTTEEMIRLVPRSQRDASLALGATRAKTSLSVLIPAALAGITTGVLLSVARVAGETAPLLFTAFGNQFWSFKLNQPIAALPLQIYNYAISPYDDWHAQAWAGALVLVILSLTINILARVVSYQFRKAR